MIKIKYVLNINVHLVGILKKFLIYLYLFMYTVRWKLILGCSNFRTDFWGYVNPNRKFIIIIYRSSDVCNTSTRCYTTSSTDFYKRVCKLALILSLQGFLSRHETLHILRTQAKTCSKDSSNVGHNAPSVSLSRSHKAVTVQRPA